MPRFPVLHHLLELAQTHVHWVGDTIQSSCPSLPPLSLSVSVFRLPSLSLITFLRLPNIPYLDHQKGKRVPEKHLFLPYWLSKPLTVWITINCGKFWKRWEYQTPWPAFWETYMQVRKQQVELDMEKEYAKAVYCHPAYLTSMQSTLWETLGWKKHKLESRLLGEISVTSYIQMTPLLWQKVKRN